MAPKKWLIIVMALGVFCTPSSSLLAASRYQVHYLGKLPGTNRSFANNLNNHNQVVGYCGILPDEVRPFLWTPGKGMQDLGSFGGNEGEARAVNNLGQVAGYSYVDASKYRAFRWTPETGLEDLGSFDNGTSAASGINDSGLVMGHSSIQNGDTLFWWTAAQGLQDLGTSGYNAYPNAMNNRGEIVGSFYASIPPGLEPHAFLWTPATGLQDLGTAGYTSQACGINDLGQVVGQTGTPGFVLSHGFFWSTATGLKLLNDPLWPNEESWPYSINIRGVIVGLSNTPDNAVTYPTMWTPIGPGLNRVLIRDLQHPDLDYILITKINDYGAMVGYDKQRREAVLLTPVRDLSPLVSLLLEE